MLQLVAKLKRPPQSKTRFNGHPPLGVNATETLRVRRVCTPETFQWAPTLGGECYSWTNWSRNWTNTGTFQWAPTLGGECYLRSLTPRFHSPFRAGFNGHPPLGVNATSAPQSSCAAIDRFNGHPPLGVNAAYDRIHNTQLTTLFQRALTLEGECYTKKPFYIVQHAKVRWFQWAPTLGGECYDYHAASTIP